MLNSPEFTKGPWELRKSSQDGVFCIRMGTFYCCGHIGLPNALLAVSAPELYAALAPFARLQLPEKPQGNAGAWSLRHEDIRRAQDALIKVTQ